MEEFKERVIQAIMKHTECSEYHCDPKGRKMTCLDAVVHELGLEDYFYDNGK